jgi:hypothetical protein
MATVSLPVKPVPEIAMVTPPLIPTFADIRNFFQIDDLSQVKQ